MADDDGDQSVITKLALSAVVIILAIPGLIIEPGPFSELAALGVLLAIWMGDGGVEDVQEQVEPN